MKIQRKKNKQAGLTLIELLLALGIISIAMVGILEFIDRQASSERAVLAGQQLEQVGKGLEKIIALEGDGFRSCIPANGTITIPIDAMIQATGTTTVGTCVITNRPLISWNAAGVPTNVFGPGYVLNIRNAGTGYITGLVTLGAPVREGNFGTIVRYDWLGIAAKAIGANGGGTFLSTGANRMNGVGAAWSITNAEFPILTQLGILGYKTNVGGELDNIYLRLDGAYPMRGDLNMGNFSINNVTDLNVNGWINGNNALVNNLKTSYLAANHIQTTTLNAATTITTGGRNPNQRPVGWGGELIKTWDIIGEGTIATLNVSNPLEIQAAMSNRGDVYASGYYFYGRDRAVGGNYTSDGRLAYTGWLMDRLPRYVLRGVSAVDDNATVPKPTCNASMFSRGGLPKIIVTPQIQNIYPDYDVMVDVINLWAPTNSITIETRRTVTARDQIQVYAIDAGSSWVVRATSLMANTYYGGSQGKALVQTFCDFAD